MSENASKLLNPEGVERVALAMIEEAPSDWRSLRLRLVEIDEHVFEPSFFVVTREGEEELEPPLLTKPLRQIQQQQRELGQPVWKECELYLERSENQPDPTMRLDFKY